MEQFLGIGHTVLSFLVVLTVLIFFHELGHFWVARRNRVRVDVFSIGFGPELFGRTDSHGTRWKVSAIPLGGYVKMFGDADASSAADGDALAEMSEEDRARSFHHKTLGQRTAIVAAGPIANFLLAIVIFAGIFMAFGQPYTPPRIGDVVADSAAAEAGFQAGDLVVEIEGRSVDRFEDIIRVIRQNLGTPVEVVVDRAGALVTLAPTPRVVEIEDRFGTVHRMGQLGVQGGEPEYVRRDPLTAVVQAGWETVELTGTIFVSLWEIISGSRSADELGGPIKIAQMSGQTAELGMAQFLAFMAMLSISLGILNLLPIPVLDGGHLLFYAVEWVRGKPLGDRAQEFGFRVGLALVLMLMVFVTWNDLGLPRIF